MTSAEIEEESIEVYNGQGDPDRLIHVGLRVKGRAKPETASDHDHSTNVSTDIANEPQSVDGDDLDHLCETIGSRYGRGIEDGSCLTRAALKRRGPTHIAPHQDHDVERVGRYHLHAVTTRNQLGETGHEARDEREVLLHHHDHTETRSTVPIPRLNLADVLLIAEIYKTTLVRSESIVEAVAIPTDVYVPRVLPATDKILRVPLPPAATNHHRDVKGKDIRRSNGNDHPLVSHEIRIQGENKVLSTNIVFPTSIATNPQISLAIQPHRHHPEGRTIFLVEDGHLGEEAEEDDPNNHETSTNQGSRRETRHHLHHLGLIASKSRGRAQGIYQPPLQVRTASKSNPIRWLVEVPIKGNKATIRIIRCKLPFL